jgi:hypothetical protein
MPREAPAANSAPRLASPDPSRAILLMLHPQLREGFGADAFDDGCVYCKSLCCCADVNAGMNTRECPRPVHCYKKVRAAACGAVGPPRWGAGQGTP